MKKSKRITKITLTAIIVGLVFVCAFLALIITNLFFPVKYFLAYLRRGQPVKEGEMRVTYIDVGHGDSTLVELPDGKTILIDAGDGAYKNVNTILKTLNECGVDNIDYLICTSVKEEHCGGFAELMKYKSVSKAYIPYCKNVRINDSYYSLVNAINSADIDYSFISRGDGFCGDGHDYFLTFLSPGSHLVNGGAYDSFNANPTPTNTDNASAIIWLEYEDRAFVFSSDARKDIFNEIIDSYIFSISTQQNFVNFDGRDIELTKCEFITVAGHGAEVSACTEWYEILNPKSAIVSVGKNYAGCPSANVITTVCNYADMYYTKYNGNVTVICKDGDAVLSKEK